MPSTVPWEDLWTGSTKKKQINDIMMEKLEYLAPAVRALDLHLDVSFCLSGGLDDTYDDDFDWDD